MRTQLFIVGSDGVHVATAVDGDAAAWRNFHPRRIPSFQVGVLASFHSIAFDEGQNRIPYFRKVFFY
jgi:hypothetical protein